MPVLPLHSLTSRTLDAKFANKQRRYAANYTASYLHQPSPPPRIAAPARAPNPTFETLRAAAAHLNLPEEEHGSFAPAATLPAKRHPVRRALLGTAMAVALCALAAGGYSAWDLRAPDGSLASGSTVLAALTQRFRDLTANQAVFRMVGEKIALLQPALLKAGLIAPPARDPAAEVPPRPPVQPVTDPAAPAAVMPDAPAASSATDIASSRPPEAAGQASAVPAPAEPTSPATTEMAPVVTAQQLVHTFALVRQMGLIVRDMQAENEALRMRAAGLTGVLQTKVAELEQRLAAAAHDMHDAHEENAQLRAEMAALADTLQTSSKALEQRLSLALARAAAEPGKQQAEAPAPPASPPAGDSPAAADATAPGSAPMVHDYHVQAASLGVAVLGDANAVPGQGGRYLVAVGDQVPGVGRVISITQRGASWVVQTDHGAIQ